MSAVAKVYARAMFELAQERNSADSVLADLKSFLESSQSHPSLKKILGGAGINANSRSAVLEAILEAAGLKGHVARLLELLVARGRFSEFPSVVAQFEEMLELSRGVRSGAVRSAVELSDAEISVLAAALAKRIGGKVRLKQTVDPSLLGGVVATVEGKTFDASLRAQLDKFRNDLI